VFLLWRKLWRILTKAHKSWPAHLFCDPLVPLCFLTNLFENSKSFGVGRCLIIEQRWLVLCMPSQVLNQS
jgi:hypothetical protein